MDNKFISRDTLQKRKARENETSSQRETRLAKQREITRQKRARENANAEEREKIPEKYSKYNSPKLEFATKKSAAKVSR
ncbi:unnamed protein product [Rhizophagus irregularis]|nr:unnamed protein product [Rhizophagus irregularis]